MANFLRTHLGLVLVGATAVLGGLAWLAFGYFGVHTLFIDNRVDEALPEFAAPPVAAADAAPPSHAGTATTLTAAAPPESTEVPAATAPPDSTEVPAATAPPEPVITTELSGTFEGLGRYSSEGRAVVIGDGSGQRFLRFEDFATDNGPDLEVYLVNSSTGDVSDFVGLGDLKGNIGSQNYELPADIDLAVYDTVMVWCVRFAVGFGQATLVPV